MVEQVQKPVVIPSVEMHLPTQHKADSLYAPMKDVADFELFAHALTGGGESSWTTTGAVNLVQYPDHLQFWNMPSDTDDFFTISRPHTPRSEVSGAPLREPRAWGALEWVFPFSWLSR